MCGITGRLTGVVVSSLIIILMSAVQVRGDNWGKVSDQEWKQGPPVNYPEANAIVLFDRGRMEVTLDAIIFTRHVRMKILNKAGIEEVGDISFSYDEDDKIRRLKAHTITPNGKKHKVSKKKFYTLKQGRNRARSFSFPSLDSGCIIEYTYQNSNKRFGNLNPWYFHSNIYTCRSEFTLVLHPGFTYSTATLNMPPQAQYAREESIPNVDNNAPLKSFTWTMSDLPPIKQEPYMSFINKYRASLHSQLVAYKSPYTKVPFIKNWPDLGQMFQESIDEYIDDKKKIRNLADSLTAGLTENRDRAEKLYDYVITKFKTDGGSGDRYYTHKKMSELIESGIGTREEKNLLLTQLLRESGFEAWPVLIGTRNNTVFMPQLYQLHQFNHMIALAQVDTELVFLDTWLKYCPYGILPPESRANGGLRLEGRDSELIRVIAKNPKTIRVDHTKIHVDSDGNAVCSTVVDCGGYFCTEFSHLVETEEHTDLIDQYFLDNIDVIYTSDTFNISHDSLNHLKFEFTYTIENFSQKLDTHIVINPIRFDFRENPFQNKNRFFPVDFNYPLSYQNMCEIYTSDSVASFRLPSPVALQIDGARFSKNCMFDGQKIISNSMLRIDTPVFTQQEYDDVREFFENVASSAEDEMVITCSSH